MDAPTKGMKIRSAIAAGIMIVVFVLIIARFFHLSIIQNEIFQAKANDYHFGTIEISAHRGSIYDANGTPLARSASVYKVFLDPKQFELDLENLQERIDEENVQKLAGTYDDEVEEKEGYVPLPVTAEAYKQQTINFLAEKLGITLDDVQDAVQRNTRYAVLQTQVETPIADAVLEYFNTYSFYSINVEEDTKRYYPQNELAAQVIGFINADGEGIYGVESYYDEYLSGTNGKVISAKDSNGKEMPYRNAKNYPAENGNDLYLSIDTTLQYYLEKNLQEMIESFEVENRACGILMNVNTGEILAMATCPSFDLNNPYDILDPAATAKIAKLTGDEKKTLVAAEREAQWKNKPILEINEPGSVIKIITSAAGIEESLVNTYGDSFECTGTHKVAERNISCHKTTGHGSQTFLQAITNSCNPAFMQIAERLGVEKFSYYIKAFGLNEKTGIDLPGESSSYYIDGEDMSVVDLAVCAFGQANAYTPMQLTVACAAAVNGGYLVTPHVVSKIVDEDGNIVLENGRNVRRQVVSEDTSKQMRDALETVVISNEAGNVNIKGYQIGGKSGTAQKLGMTGESAEDQQYVASYLCFAPAEDPEIVLYVMADMPNKNIEYYGSKVAVPTARDIMEDILPYMGYYPQYDESEYDTLDVSVPLLQDKNVEDAKATVSALGLECEVIGEGSTVISQSPITGSKVAYNGVVYLYTESNTSQSNTTTVPDLHGVYATDANESIVYNGLNYTSTGTSITTENATVKSQSIPPGTVVPKGTVVELEFYVYDIGAE